MTETKSTVSHKLGDYGELRTMEKTLKMEDIQGVPVTIVSFELEDGRFGEFAWLQINMPGKGRVKVRCGGSFVIKALKEAQTADALPVEATFVQRGNAWVVE